MATFVQAVIGSNDAAGTSLSASSISVNSGDLILVCGKWEGAADGTANITDGTNSYSSAIAQAAHSNNDLNVQIFKATAASTGSLTITLNTASRSFRKISVAAFRPAGGTSLVADTTATASGSASSSPSAGTASNAAAGCAITMFALYSSSGLTPGSGWTNPAVWDVSSSLLGEYRLPTGAGSITGNGTTGGIVDWIAQMVIMQEEVSATGNPHRASMMIGIG